MAFSRLRVVWLLWGLICGPVLASETLENAFWRVELDPATLAIRVQPTGAPAVEASVGATARAVSQLERMPGQLSWLWDDGAWRLEAHLEQHDLILTIKAREAGYLEFLRQPAHAMGNGLIWPLAEGRYVPRGDAVWQQFLAGQGVLNTTQDLSLPLWGMDHGTFSLTWLMTNPFNNRLSLTAQDDGVAISATHEFTSLAPRAAMTFRLHLGDADPLAGARRYRQWLIDSGAWHSLDEKIAMTPQARKLLGAAHIYLWGNDLLGLDDVQSWPRLLSVLASSEPLAVRLRGFMDGETRAMLKDEPGPLPRRQQVLILRSLNGAFNSAARQRWRSAVRPDMQVLASSYGEVRVQVAKLFGDALAKDPTQWGSTLTGKTIESLRVAGLKRLWIGLGDGWEGGLWHPEAVREALRAGYLIAPYDSYQTALADHENPDWVTAHLGSDAHRNCAIVLKSGKLKSGFQQSGHYTDPRCVRPLLNARVQAIREAAGFNSWFLDAYATGMVFDSYHPSAALTQSQNAAANADAARWVAEGLGLVVGSEDGNASTSQGILFAHGMQTPVIGWGEKAMSRDRQSPWYLGNWHPPHEPAVFFTPVPLMERYRAVHFDPATRLPLYQAVFHGSVVTTHHWLFDSLKLSNVRVQSELLQLLYNVPPLYHVSHASLDARLAVIHRQDHFFRPLHELLATQTMTGFQWLTGDRLVQQTTFADGSRLVANFDGNVRVVEDQSFAAHSVTAFLSNGEVSVYEVKAS